MPRPHRTVSARFWEKVNKNGPVPAHKPDLGRCWVWTGAFNEHGYGILHGPGKHGRLLRAHRISAELAGLDIKGRVVRHRCDYPACVNPAHLLVGTQLENVHDMHEGGRGNVGSVNGQAKLTDEQVLEIRAKLAGGIQGKALAAEYSISEPVVSVIKNAKGWRHLATEPVIVPVRDRHTIAACACGCGGKFTTPDKWGNERRWLRGHHRRGEAA